ncbi:antitoxin MazE family protein [Candidatus Glomeribacter gigasporarum]|uniref:antitoxin MazE family protein n=1 Tax=Candidatus Glomeribacter gigasporarum TaxID=132144 RepID=UPI0005B2B97F|nr:antitoxin MazE family protein [Candidatus Glomeribacter gigasporarum]
MNVISHQNRAAAVQRQLRDQRRASGMRPVQIWVPDTRRPEFAEECRRQAHNVAAHATRERQVMDWVESVSDITGWDA